MSITVSFKDLHDLNLCPNDPTNDKIDETVETLHMQQVFQQEGQQRRVCALAANRSLVDSLVMVTDNEPVSCYKFTHH